MKRLRYLEWLYNMFDVYKNESIQAAYDYATEYSQYVKGSLAGIYLYRIILAAELANKELLMKLLEEAVIQNNFWYPTNLFFDSSNYDIVKDIPTFTEIMRLCETREKERKYSRKPVIEIFKADDSTSRLLIALHGDQQEIEAVYEYWNPKKFFNHIVAIPTSSVDAYSGGFTWSDINLGVQELKTHYNDLIEKYEFDKENIIISAFSSGTTVALTSIVNEEIEVGGIILVSPPIQNLAEIKDKFHILKKNNVSTYILCGDQDDRFLPMANMLAKHLEQVGARYKLNISVGTKHEYPLNFDMVLKDIKLFFDL